ncbi:MAG: alpha/beta family hydrolase [Acidobacteriota bacterium]
MAERIEAPGIRGWLHRPAGAPVAALGITHGAGSNCDSPLLLSVAEAFAENGFVALRYNLPYRQQRPSGPPVGNAGPRDRDGIREVSKFLREQTPGVPLYLSGHSYGGRQTTMLAAEDASVADALLLLSYPLHPPGQPEKPRTDHFPGLRVPSLFVHGSRDEFGEAAELEEATQLLPARHALQVVEGAPHGLPPKLAGQIVDWFVTFTLLPS